MRYAQQGKELTVVGPIKGKDRMTIVHGKLSNRDIKTIFIIIVPQFFCILHLL